MYSWNLIWVLSVFKFAFIKWHIFGGLYSVQPWYPSLMQPGLVPEADVLFASTFKFILHDFFMFVNKGYAARHANPLVIRPDTNKDIRCRSLFNLRCGCAIVQVGLVPNRLRPIELVHDTMVEYHYRVFCLDTAHLFSNPFDCGLYVEDIVSVILFNWTILLYKCIRGQYWYVNRRTSFPNSSANYSHSFWNMQVCRHSIIISKQSRVSVLLL